jgi:type II secretory pathway predicted ATPase ExeA
MYSAQFDLVKNPFPALATGADVFICPQAARLIQSARPAFERSDAIVAVSGPDGVGKSTLVNKAIAATGLRRKTMFVGAEACPADSVLQSLLLVLGIDEPPAERTEQLKIWQQLRDKLSATDTHMFIMLEDAVAIGADVVGEFAALSADSGDSGAGVRLVLMGDDALDSFMALPALSATRERVSLQHQLLPYSDAEIRGYLRHAFRVAGGDCDAIFENNCMPLLVQLSDGIPGTVNAIVETVLSLASEKGIQPVTAKLIADVAARAYNSQADRFDFRRPVSETPKHQHKNVMPANGQPKVLPLPDLDALARAIATAHGGDLSALAAGEDSSHETDSWTGSLYGTSETAREKTITCGMDSASEFGLPTDTLASTLTESADDLDKVAAKLARARTLDDVDDAMAETLFGNEIEQFASAFQSAANDSPSPPREQKRPGS